MKSFHSFFSRADISWVSPDIRWVKMRNICSTRDQLTSQPWKWDGVTCGSRFKILLLLISGIDAHLNPNHAGILPNSIAYIKRLSWGFGPLTGQLDPRNLGVPIGWKPHFRMYKPDVPNEILVSFLRLRGRLILQKNMNSLLKIQKEYLNWILIIYKN